MLCWHGDTSINAGAAMLMSGSMLCRYMGVDGIYTHTMSHDRKEDCPMCSPGMPMEVSSSDTLQQVSPTSLQQLASSSACRNSLHLHAAACLLPSQLQEALARVLSR